MFGSATSRLLVSSMAAVMLGAAALCAQSAAAGGTSLPIGYAGSATGTGVGPAGTGVGPADSASFTSRNWAGYVTYAASETTDFNVVKATWVEPVVTCKADQAWTVFWVGLDGWYDGTVEQGGSEAYCATAGGPASYNLWWEMFPTNSIQTELAINAGDTITASVTYSTKTAIFTIVVKDVTTKKSITEKESCAPGLTCGRSSAEAITEDVGRFGQGNYFPLADYGSMGYSNSQITDVAKHRGSISGKKWLNAAITEQAGNITYATVSPLSSSGAAFSTTWEHA